MTNAGEHERVGPALGRALDDAEQQRAEADDRQRPRRAGRACPGWGRGTSGCRKTPAIEGDDADRDVDPEHRAPREVLEQQAAGDRADGHGETGEAGPDGDRPAPLAGIAEHVGQDRQRRRHDQRAADAHERPAGDQVDGRRRQRRRGRADGEQHDADLQGALAAEAVAEAARREQQAGEDERVGVDDPLDLAVGRVEVA